MKTKPGAPFNSHASCLAYTPLRNVHSTRAFACILSGGGAK